VYLCLGSWKPRPRREREFSGKRVAYIHDYDHDFHFCLFCSIIICHSPTRYRILTIHSTCVILCTFSFVNYEQLVLFVLFYYCTFPFD
jgi:hypothetical protein